MATFFINENNELKNKKFKIPNNLKQHLQKTLATYSKYKTNNGYKRLNSLINPEYNKRNKTKDNERYISYSDLKRIDFDLRHMDQSDNNIDWLLNGGQEMASFVRDTLNRERTKVTPTLKRQKQQTREKNQIKPIKNPTKPQKLNQINIHESLSNQSDHPYFERLSDYDEFYVFSAFKNHENIWMPLIDPNMYKKALDEYTKYGKFIHFPTKYIYQWMGIIMKNTALLRAMTEIAGHTKFFPLDSFIDFFFNGDNDEWDEYKTRFCEEHDNFDFDDDFFIAYEYLIEIGYDDWAQLPDGSDAISDYGIEPLEEIISEYNENSTPEQTIVIINKSLDIVHCRGDLSSMFIKGGAKTLTAISESIKRKKIIISEQQFINLKKKKLI